MKKKVAPRDFIIYLILLSVMCATLVDSTFKLVLIPYNLRTVLIIIVATLIYFWLVTTYRYSFFVIFLLFILFKPNSIIAFFRTLIWGWKDFISSVITNQNVIAEFAGYYTDLIYVLIVLVLLLAYLIVVLRKNTIAILIFGCTIFVSYYFLGLNSVFKSCGTYLIFNLILYAFNEYLKKKDKWSVEDTEVRRNYFYRWLSLTVILVILTNFMVQILPYNAKPLNLNWFEVNVLSRFEGINGIGGRSLSSSGMKSKFRLYYTGYQQNSNQLGGPIKIDNSQAFSVSSSDDIDGLHLRGSVNDEYNGHSWSQSDTFTQKVQGEIDNESLDMQYSLKKIDIFPKKTITTTVFNALYPLTVKNRWNYVYVDSNLEIFNPRSVGSGSSYEVTYKEFSVNEMKEKLKELNYNLGEMNYETELQKYLQLPTLPERVYKLTKNIIDKYKTPYEKASAIENYLKSNYSYSTDTAVPPSNDDFVDDFLFNEKKGYCTYYASAMAVMCRIANIPSRYVEGFVVPKSNENGGQIKVLNSDAHAWVELYFDGIGWITFDPTPGMDSMAMDLTQQGKVGNSNSNNNPSSASGSNNVRPTPARPNLPKDNNPADSSRKSAEKNGLLIPLYIACGIFGILILITFILLIKALIFRKKRFLAYSLHRIIYYIGISGIPYNKGETLREYFEKFGKESGIDLKELTEVYENILYGSRTYDNGSINVINNSEKKIVKYVIKQRGKIKFLFLSIMFIFYLPFHSKLIKNIFLSK